MEKIKHYRLNLSLRKSLVLYVAVFAVLALILSIMTISICDNTVDTIRKSYPLAGEKYYLTNEQGKRLGDGTYIGNVPVMPSGQDERIITLLELFSTIAAPVYSALCIIAAAFLFYRDKLKKPLANLRIAAEKISNNDLDFAVGYDSKDELGELVDSFEIMRTALVNNFSEMWKQVEERKALNAAFAHDLRTPLTVLKGYNEMLQVDADERTRKIAATMGKHISRMEAYVSSMSSLRRLEDTQPKYEAVSLQPFLSSLQENAQMVCTQNRKAVICRYNSLIFRVLSAIHLGKVCGIYILIIKRLYCLTFASPTFVPCMACIVVPCFAFTVMSEDDCLHIRFSNLVKYKITQKLSNIKLLKD